MRSRKPITILTLCIMFSAIGLILYGYICNKNDVFTSQKPSKDTLNSELNGVSFKEESEGTIGNACVSSPHSLLEVGDLGIVSVMGSMGKAYNTCIKLNYILRDKAAEEKIKELLEKEGEVYKEPQIGCSYELINYELLYNVIDESVLPDKFYLDCHIRGFNNEKLVYRGIVYSQRTYDLLEEFKCEDKNYGYTDGYIYYEVPNGCTEYMLVFGESIYEHNEDVYNAY